MIIVEETNVLPLLHIRETTMRRRLLSGLLVVASIALMQARSAYAADDETQAVKQAVTGFHDALNMLFKGDAAPMKAAWSHADDVSYMGPVGGMQVGWSQVEPYWDAQAAKKLGGKVDPVDVHVTASPTLAVVHYYEKGENVIDGKPQPVSIRATTTFRKEGGTWKVIGHHTDTLAYLQK
jgi:ketosteroid isomerase-like protein